jgi:hypothetical protein
MLEGILRKRKIIMEKKNNKVQILIRKIINANNMNSYKKTIHENMVSISLNKY